MTSRHDYDLICIGSGPAGQRAAVQAAKLGRRVAVVEKQRCVGGVCIETGTIPSKTFREAVRCFVAGRNGANGANGAAHAHDVGRARPSMEQLLGRVAYVIQREGAVVQDQLARNDVELGRGHATFAGPHTLLVQAGASHRTLTSEYILVAVGTRPDEPRGVKPDGSTLILSDGILSLERLPRSMVVVGGG